MVTIKPANRKITFDSLKETIVKETGDYLQVTQMAIPSKTDKKKQNVSKVMGTKKEDFKIKNRAEGVKSLRRTMHNISDLVNCNVTSASRNNCLWMTLTYDHLERDPKKIGNDFEIFIKRLRRYLKKIDRDDFGYISVVEPQASGSFHFHVILIFSKCPPFIPNNEILERKLWEHGFTSIKSLSALNPGAYLAAYLSDMIVTPSDTTDAVKTQENGSKRIVKGARLYFYPAGMKIIRASRNIKRPNIKKMSASEAENILKNYEEFKRYDFQIISDDGKIINEGNRRYMRKI